MQTLANESPKQNPSVEKQIGLELSIEEMSLVSGGQQSAAPEPTVSVNAWYGDAGGL